MRGSSTSPASSHLKTFRTLVMIVLIMVSLSLFICYSARGLASSPELTSLESRSDVPVQFKSDILADDGQGAVPEPLAAQRDTVKRKITLFVSWQPRKFRCVSTGEAASHTVLDQSRSNVNGQAQKRQIEKE